MTGAVQEMDGTKRIVLPAAVDIEGAESLLARCREAVADAGALSIDAGGVESVDTAGLQILIATRAALVEAGGELRWERVSPALAEAARLAGAAGALGLDGTAE